MSRIQSLAIAAVALVGAASSASADSLVRPGSLLVFPAYDNYEPLCTITVTNTNNNLNPVSSAPGALATGTVDVEFVYIEEYTCLEFNRTRRLTPNDTITVVTRNDNPSGSMGYVYAFAKSPTTGRAIKWDYLVGNSFTLSPNNYGGTNFDPIVFKAASGIAEGAVTDLDNDFVRDLDGVEYEKVSDKLLVPRFVSQEMGLSEPQLILIGLSGSAFTTIVDFLIYNDNEEVFSAQYSFVCYKRVGLAQINGAFTNSFLQSSNHAAPEFLTLPTAKCKRWNASGLYQLETGWYRMDSSIAYSTAASIQNPAFLAASIDMLPASGAGLASLPYGIGEQANGDLVPHGPFPN